MLVLVVLMAFAIVALMVFVDSVWLLTVDCAAETCAIDCVCDGSDIITDYTPGV